ncbi:MAG: hypothetical protein QOF42_2450 [Gammaproteobacteria bacterium]|jgi:hypothetical protein|nr:hypothetical protein [Gammaproteobacteria bacterium]
MRALRRVRPSHLMAAVSLLGATCANAADVFIQPNAYIGAETNSNLDLTPGGQAEVTGYNATVASIIGIATPNSAITFKPRLDYRDYPTDRGDDRLEEYLEFNGGWKGQRSNAGISGNYDHRDEFNAELQTATFDEINPVQPTAPQTGRTVTGGTRNSFYVLPTYTYDLTQRFAAGVSGLYQKVNYSPNDDARFVDFNYYQGKAFVVWTLNQKSDLNFGGYYNDYNATRFFSKASATGASVDLNTSWSPLLTTRASVTYQRSDIQAGQAPAFAGSLNVWGGAMSAVYKGETTQLRGDLSRLITPSGGGSVYVVNQAQVEYDRKLTQRLSFIGAVIYQQDRALTANVAGDGRNYLRTLLDIKWMMTRTFYIQGGYSYTWQQYQLDPDGAANNRFYLRFGYQGMGRQY